MWSVQHENVGMCKYLIDNGALMSINTANNNVNILCISLNNIYLCMYILNDGQI